LLKSALQRKDNLFLQINGNSASTYADNP
jgi:hypothetical protein